MSKTDGFSHKQRLIEYGCKIEDMAIMDSEPFFSHITPKKSEYFERPLYPDPPRDLKNIIIWGSSYNYDNYKIQGKNIYDLIGQTIDESKIYYFYLDSIYPKIISIYGYDELIDSIFCKYAGYINNYYVVCPEKELIYFFNEELEYTLYFRNFVKNINPFPLITDQMILSEFNRRIDDFYSSAKDGVRVPHLTNEILPFTEFAGKHQL